MKHHATLFIFAVSLFVLGAACSNRSISNSSVHSGSMTFRSAGANAFGALSGLTTTAPANPTTTDSAAGSGTAALKTMPIMPFSTIKYVFTGTPLTLVDTNVTVFKRNAGAGLPIPSNLRGLINLGVMNFGTLTNPTIQNLTIRDGDEFWTVDPLNGTISMYRNATNGTIVPMLKGIATDLAQPPNTNGATNTNIDTASAIRIANAYLASRGISASGYGQPIATANNVFAMDATAKAAAIASGDSLSARPIQVEATVQIVYPLMINGIPVVQQSGDPLGLTLTVDTTNSLVTSLYGLSTFDLTSSAYPALTDWSIVQAMAERGGLYGYVGAPDEKATTVNLGTPDRVLMDSYLYNGITSSELYVPALRFPLLNPPAGYSQAIVVPLAKDLNPNGDGSVPSATSGSSGSGVTK